MTANNIRHYKTMNEFTGFGLKAFSWLRVMLPGAWASSLSEVYIKNCAAASAEGEEVYQVWEDAKIKVGPEWKVCKEMFTGHASVGDASIWSHPLSLNLHLTLIFLYPLLHL